MNLTTKTAIIAVYVILVLVPGSCRATRIGSMKVSSDMGSRRTRHEMGFEINGQKFHFMSKKARVPPSGPSKRHNSLQH
ncbi:PREDICTED: protein IDA-LIKE 1 [Tarenaya hassleriana]|uniref:protein IDA-LIKE 1 n=1 Tax=Tarenaya hassleriana TaxID=28532 RepID=UPI00053C16B8|nr:PREDICTED: protein IDA-LIKE 1 [Tarenaya hassleriana]